MQMPNLPTDNLYKLIAITGLLLTVGAIVLSVVVTERFVEREHEYSESVDSLEVQVSGGRDALDRLAKSSGNSKSSAAIAEVSSALSRQENARVAVAKAERKFQHAERQAKFWDWTFVVLVSIGIFLQFLGFSLWYYRLQRYQDAQLKSEALAHRRFRFRRKMNSTGQD